MAVIWLFSVVFVLLFQTFKPLVLLLTQQQSPYSAPRFELPQRKHLSLVVRLLSLVVRLFLVITYICHNVGREIRRTARESGTFSHKRQVTCKFQLF